MSQYLIKNGTQYLYYNKALFKGGYHFKDGKVGATVFTKEKAKRVIAYLKRKGFFEVERKRVKGFI